MVKLTQERERSRRIHGCIRMRTGEPRGQPAHAFTQGPSPFPRAPVKRTSGRMARLTVFEAQNPASLTLTGLFKFLKFGNLP